jgi:hypothetical protein
MPGKIQACFKKYFFWGEFAPSHPASGKHECNLKGLESHLTQF